MQWHRSKFCQNKRSIFLVEAVIAIGVLAIVLNALAAALIMLFNNAAAGLMRNIAYNTAQMYIEQIYGMDQDTFTSVMKSPGTTPFPTLSILTNNDGTKSVQGDPIYLNYANMTPGESVLPIEIADGTNTKNISFRRIKTLTNSVQTQTFPIVYTLYVTDLTTLKSPVAGYAIVLRFQYEVPYLKGKNNSLVGKVYAIRPFLGTL